MAGILPTGRNFYSVDPKTIPSPAAWETGRRLAESLLEKYLEEEGAYPEMVGMVVWGTSAMRTHGDDVAQILHLLGIRPVWQPESRRVMGLDVIPLAELGRPRIDVTVRISGFFRDAFPNLINLLDHGSGAGSFPGRVPRRQLHRQAFAGRPGQGKSCRTRPQGCGRTAVMRCTPQPQPLSNLRKQARFLRRRDIDRVGRTQLGNRGGPGGGLHRLGRVRLHPTGPRCLTPGPNSGGGSVR